MASIALCMWAIQVLMSLLAIISSANCISFMAVVLASLSLLATFFGVAPSTIYAWKAQFPEFSEAIREGEVPAGCLVPERIFERACSYE